MSRSRDAHAALHRLATTAATSRQLEARIRTAYRNASDVKIRAAAQAVGSYVNELNRGTGQLPAAKRAALAALEALTD